MWREPRIWNHYLNDVIATDAHSADFLYSYISYLRISKAYANNIEIVDLQKYRVIKQTPKVRIALRERMNLPFIFVVSKN